MHKQMKAAQLTELNEEFIKNSQLLENYNCSITFELNEKDIQHGLNYLPQAELTLTYMTLFPSHLENKMFHGWLFSLGCFQKLYKKLNFCSLRREMFYF